MPSGNKTSCRTKMSGVAVAPCYTEVSGEVATPCHFEMSGVAATICRSKMSGEVAIEGPSFSLQPKPALKRSTRSGQMMVELAVCIPVILAVVAVTLNIMGYLNVCASFDRLAPEAVRVEATSPGYGQYGSNASAKRIQNLLQDYVDTGRGAFNVEASVSVSGGSSSIAPAQGLSFLMQSRLETYDCSITYHPWPFENFAGLSFITLTHHRFYTVDPYRPGVLL